MPKILSEQEKQAVIRAANEYDTMRQAAKSLNLPYRTFIERAKSLNVYAPKQNQIGVKKGGNPKIPLEDILAGLHPQYETARLRHRLIEDRVLEYTCSECSLGSCWNGKKLVLQLDHINGDRFDHREHNLRFLCPNCHTQTPTWGSKNGRAVVSDEEILEQFGKSKTIKGTMVSLGLSNSSTTHYRISKLIESVAE